MQGPNLLDICLILTMEQRMSMEVSEPRQPMMPQASAGTGDHRSTGHILLGPPRRSEKKQDALASVPASLFGIAASDCTLPSPAR